MTTCSKCREAKPEEEFNWKVKNVKRSGVCKECHSAYRKEHYKKNRQKYIDKARKWEADNGGKNLVKYKLTEEAYQELLDKYNGKCWICKKNEATSVDHDHSCCAGAYTCGKCVRGILCNHCNCAIGLFNDQIDTMLQAVDYVSSFKS